MTVQIVGNTLSSKGEIKENVQVWASHKYEISDIKSRVEIRIRPQTNRSLILPPCLPAPLLALVESYYGWPLPTIRPFFNIEPKSGPHVYFPLPPLDMPDESKASWYALSLLLIFFVYIGRDTVR